MMRAARRASLLVAFYLLTSVATAYAECAWVMWLEVYDPAHDSQWSVKTAHETKAECDIAVVKAGQALLGGNFELDSAGRGFRPKQGAQYLLFRPTCLPSDTDPRGPKGGGR